MKFVSILWILGMGLFSATEAYRQEEHSHVEEEQSHHNSIAILLSHSYISLGKSDGERDLLIVPSFALNYNYLFNKK